MRGVVKISIMWEKVLERVCVIYIEANLGTAEVFIERAWSSLPLIPLGVRFIGVFLCVFVLLPLCCDDF